MTEEGGKFARVVDGTKVFVCGHLFYDCDPEECGDDMSAGAARGMATNLNAAHEKLLAEAVREAKEEMRETCAKACISAGLMQTANIIRSIEVKP